MILPCKVCMWASFGSFFMFSNYYWLDLHNETCIASASINKNCIEDWTYPNFTWLLEVHICWLFQLNTFIVLSIVFTIECGAVNII